MKFLLRDASGEVFPVDMPPEDVYFDIKTALYSSELAHHNEQPQLNSDVTAHAGVKVSWSKGSCENYSDGDERIEQLCRLCGNVTGESIYIFGNAGTRQNIADKINMCLPITVKTTDPLPKQLCTGCLLKLDICHEFAESCIQAEGKLQNLCKENKFKSCLLSKLSTRTGQENFSAECNMTVEVNNEHVKGKHTKHPSSSYCCPLCCLGNMQYHRASYLVNKNTKEMVEPEESSTHNECSVNDVTSDSCQNVDEDFAEISAICLNDKKNYKNPSTCRIVGATLESAELSHSLCTTATNEYCCSTCDLHFSSEADFVAHYTCHLCKETKEAKASEQYASDVHKTKLIAEKSLLNISSNRSYSCYECGALFETNFKDTLVKCKFCEKEFNYENSLRDQEELVRKRVKPYCCDQCGKTFQIKTKLLTHQRVHCDEKSFECEICGGKFYDKAALKVHCMTHTNEKSYQCEKCGQCFSQKLLFVNHSRTHLTTEEKIDQFKCNMCVSLTFPTYAKLSEHRKKTHSQFQVNIIGNRHVSRPFKCDDCGKSFAYTITLATHRKTHSGELPFQCDFCGKNFVQNRSLILHRRTHTGEKPYECTVCGKRFVQTSHLYAHQRLHTGEKPYSCETCGQSFRLKDVRDAHCRKHTGERPFKCSVCEKCFRTSHSYYQHMWIHQGKKPYPCQYCGKRFRRSNGLKIHIRIHTGEKPHACDICGRNFAQKQDMRKHRKLHAASKL